MITFGNLSQYVALGLTLGTFVLLLLGILKNDFRYIISGRRAFIFTALFTTMAATSLAYLFATDAFQVEYVASYSDRALPIFYKI
jgi:cytochrome c-type biogenesis protein CcmF